MSRGSEVIVHRGGFLSALAYGFFGLLTATIVCGAGVGVYAIHVADSRSEQIIGTGVRAIESLPELIESLPPALADVLDDRRAPDYRRNVDIKTRLVPEGENRANLVIEAANGGNEMITLLAVRVVLTNKEDIPVRAVSSYLATPLTVENDWRGPLMSGSTRRCSLRLYGYEEDLKADIEVTDLRVWRGEPGTELTRAPQVQETPPVPAHEPQPPTAPVAVLQDLGATTVAE